MEVGRSIWLALTHEQMATLTCDRTPAPTRKVSARAIARMWWGMRTDQSALRYRAGLKSIIQGFLF
ncbi:MAG: hypothetical protein AB1861_22090 [Cyanobacteriota bacterium]